MKIKPDDFPGRRIVLTITRSLIETGLVLSIIRDAKSVVSEEILEKEPATRFRQSFSTHGCCSIISLGR